MVIRLNQLKPANCIIVEHEFSHIDFHWHMFNSVDC